MPSKPVIGSQCGIFKFWHQQRNPRALHVVRERAALETRRSQTAPNGSDVVRPNGRDDPELTMESPDMRRASGCPTRSRSRGMPTGPVTKAHRQTCAWDTDSRNVSTLLAAARRFKRAIGFFDGRNPTSIARQSCCCAPSFSPGCFRPPQILST